MMLNLKDKKKKKIFRNFQKIPKDIFKRKLCWSVKWGQCPSDHRAAGEKWQVPSGNASSGRILKHTEVAFDL